LCWQYNRVFGRFLAWKPLLRLILVLSWLKHMIDAGGLDASLFLMTSCGYLWHLFCWTSNFQQTPGISPFGTIDMVAVRT
jgi:hypothetical protein